MSEEQKQNTTGQPEFQAEFQAIVEACERLKVLSVQSGKKLVTTYIPPSAFYWCNYCTKYSVCGTVLAENVVEGQKVSIRK